MMRSQSIDDMELLQYDINEALAGAGTAIEMLCESYSELAKISKALEIAHSMMLDELYERIAPDVSEEPL